MINKIQLKVIDGPKKGQKVFGKYNNHGKIVSMNGKPFYCGCTGNTYETASIPETTPNGLECACGKKIKIIKTREEFQKEENEKEKLAIENLHLTQVHHSISSGIKYYGLSTRIDYSKWLKVKDFFMYYTYDEEDEEQDSFFGTTLRGWVTRAPEKVEKILNIKEENTLNYKKIECEKQRKEHDKIKKERNNLKEEIDKAFENAEYPESEYPQNVKGEIIEDPEQKWNIYGGGHEWRINKEENSIWGIKNNGFDGADWSQNNVATAGAGAIGHRVEYSKELEKLIRTYVSL